MTSIDQRRALGSFLQDRFASAPGWLLAAQMFLAFGWLRAGLAHGMTTEWWDGTEITTFVAEHRDQALPFYRPFLDSVVVERPMAIATIVLTLEVAAGLMLIANVRPLTAVAIGAWLNLHFILAGAVNPSIFYLLIAAAILLARTEEGLATLGPDRLARVASIVAVFAVVGLTPFIATVDPAMAIEDPALTLIFLSLLTAAGAWAVAARPAPGPQPGLAPDVVNLFGGPVAEAQASTAQVGQRSAQEETEAVLDLSTLESEDSEPTGLPSFPSGGAHDEGVQLANLIHRHRVESHRRRRRTTRPTAGGTATERTATERTATRRTAGEGKTPTVRTCDPTPNLYTAEQVLQAVEERTGKHFDRELHQTVAERLGVRVGAHEKPRTIDPLFAQCWDMADPYLYSDDWVELLCHALGSNSGFAELTGREPVGEATSGVSKD